MTRELLSPWCLCQRWASCDTHSPSPRGGLQTPNPASFPFSFLIWLLRCCLFSAPKLPAKPRLSPTWLCGRLWFPLWVLNSECWVHLLAASLNRPPHSFAHSFIHSFIHSSLIKHLVSAFCVLLCSIYSLERQRQIKYCPVFENLTYGQTNRDGEGVMRIPVNVYRVYYSGTKEEAASSMGQTRR